MALNRTAVDAAMTAALDDLTGLRWQLVFAPPAPLVEGTLRRTLEVLASTLTVLAGEGRAAVLGDGGPHGSPEAAYAAWVDSATSAAATARGALGLAGEWTPLETLVKAGGGLVSTVAALAPAAGVGFGAVLALLVALVAWRVLR